MNYLWKCTLGTLVLAVVLSASMLNAQAPASTTESAAGSQASTSGWAPYPLGSGSDEHYLQRGEGAYLSVVKLFFLLTLFFMWVKTTDWVAQDARLLRLNHALWVPGVFFSFLAGFFLFALLIYYFFIGYIVFLAAYVGPLGWYIYVRNQAVSIDERVLTKDHFRALLSRKARKVGVKIDAEKKADYEQGAQVEMTAMGGDERTNTGNLIKARQSPGFVIAKDLIEDAFVRRADKVMLDYTREFVSVRYQIDGVWHDLAKQERESGDMMLAVFKTLANLDGAERVKRQDGKFGAATKGTKLDMGISAQGTKTGERAVISLNRPVADFKTFAELGMREKVAEQVLAAIAGEQGLVLFAAMPAGGLTTTYTVALRSSDRFMRDFVALEEADHQEPEIENVEQVTFSDGSEPSVASALEQILRKEPNVLVMPNLADAEAAKILCREACAGRVGISTIRAKEAVEALLRILLMKVPADEFAPAVSLVVNQRLIRKLCPTCREAYAPTAEQLKKLGIPEGRVKAFYRPPTQQMEEICGACGGIGYLDRTSIFEVLAVDDAMREALIKQPKIEVLREVARKAGQRTLQEEGIVLVAKGVTSLPELGRVLKQ